MHMRKVQGLVQEQVTGARNVARAAYGTYAGAGARAADVTGAKAAAARVADVKSAGAAAARAANVAGAEAAAARAAG